MVAMAADMMFKYCILVYGCDLSPHSQSQAPLPNINILWIVMPCGLV